MRIDGGVSIPVREADGRDVISVALLKKSMDAMKVSGEDMKKLLEQSVNPNLGKHIDIKI